jgi:hypothetical protein
MTRRSNPAEEFQAEARACRQVRNGWRWEVVDGEFQLRGPGGVIAWRPSGQLQREILERWNSDGNR